MNREKITEQSFSTELDDPNVVAALATLGFPVKSGNAVELRDLGSLHVGKKASRAWHVGQFSQRYGALAQTLQAWNKPLPSDPVPALHAAMVCKLALHNRRCLQVFLQHGGSLHFKSLGAFGRLGNFGMRGGSQVEEVFEENSAYIVWDTHGAAAAITLGHALAGYVRRGGEVGWLVLPGDSTLCVFAVADVLGLLGDAQAIAKREDPAALVVATLRNRDFLVRGADRAGKIKIFHKNGRYAVLGDQCSQRVMVAAARHLNT